MAREQQGQLYENTQKRGTTFGLRFRLPDGRRVYEKLGADYGPDPIDRREAEARAERVMAQVALSLYRTKAERIRDREERETGRRTAPLFGPFAEEWYQRRCDLGGRTGEGLSESGRGDLRNILDQHLLPWFAGLPMDEIDVEEVERYAAAKRREGRIGATYLNKTLATLSGIFKSAVRYGRVPSNPAEDVRVAAPRFRRSYLDRAEAITALLDAATAKDREGRVPPFRRALLALLVYAGPRIDEALSLRWRDVDLACGTVRLPGRKTENAERTVDLLPVLRDELAAYAAGRRDRRPSGFVFTSSTGRKLGDDNVRNRVVAPAVEKASAALEESGRPPLPDRVTPHSLRCTFASLLYAMGESPPYVMAQMGHSTPHLALAVYARVMDRRDGEPERLKALVNGEPMPALEGTSAGQKAAERHAAGGAAARR